MITSYYLFIVLGFLAVVLLLEGIYIAWNTYHGPKARSIAKRLRILSAGAQMESAHASLIKNRLLSKSPAVESLLLSIPRIHSLDRLIVQSGVDVSVSTFLGMSAISYAGGAMLLALMKFPVSFAVTAAFATALLPLALILNQRRNRIAKIEEQLPDALDLIGRALRAGHAFQGAVQMVADESPEPIASEFRAVFDEINFGVSVQEALSNMAARVASTDLRYFVIAVMIQRDTGGNLAELLDKLSLIMRERFKLIGSVRVLSAEGKLSAWILSILPFAVALMVNIVNPGFLDILFTDPGGQRLLATTAVLMVIGIFWLWRLTKIRI